MEDEPATVSNYARLKTVCRGEGVMEDEPATVSNHNPLRRLCALELGVIQ